MKQLGDGRMTCHGPMLTGFQLALGPMALLQSGGVSVVDATRSFFEGAAAMIEATDYADACPIATVALEVASRFLKAGKRFVTKEGRREADLHLDRAGEAWQ